MDKPSISALIPTYNCAKYIAKSIDSVLAQTYPAAEILIVNDGSTDDTPNVVSAYADPRLRYIEIPHAGIAAARNKGIEDASSDYLAFLDADDLWRPAMLEKHVAVMDHDRSLVCSFSNFNRFADETGETLSEQFVYYPELATLPVLEAGSCGALVVKGDAFA